MKPYQDPEWQAALDRMAPPGGQLSWLHLYWEPGFEWEPVGRWMIAQIIPSANITSGYREMLEGPNPANYGYFETDEYGQKRWVSTLPGITRQQWQWYQDHGTLFRPYFVVQGSKGGHRLRFTFWERKIIEINGGNPEPPAPGDLPYAAPDRRTWDLLAKQDLLRKYSAALDFIDRNPSDFKENAEGERQMRAMFWQHLQDQIEPYADEMAFHLDLDEAPETTKDYGVELEKLEESFITEGA